MKHDHQRRSRLFFLSTHRRPLFRNSDVQSFWPLCIHEYPPKHPPRGRRWRRQPKNQNKSTRQIRRAQESASSFANRRLLLCPAQFYPQELNCSTSNICRNSRAQKHQKKKRQKKTPKRKPNFFGFFCAQLGTHLVRTLGSAKFILKFIGPAWKGETRK